MQLKFLSVPELHTLPRPSPVYQELVVDDNIGREIYRSRDPDDRRRRWRCDQGRVPVCKTTSDSLCHPSPRISDLPHDFRIKVLWQRRSVIRVKIKTDVVTWVGLKGDSLLTFSIYLKFFILCLDKLPQTRDVSSVLIPGSRLQGISSLSDSTRVRWDTKDTP